MLSYSATYSITLWISSMAFGGFWIYPFQVDGMCIWVGKVGNKLVEISRLSGRENQEVCDHKLKTPFLFSGP